jgi:hypothetical protein
VNGLDVFVVKLIESVSSPKASRVIATPPPSTLPHLLVSNRSIRPIVIEVGAIRRDPAPGREDPVFRGEVAEDVFGQALGRAVNEVD